MESTTAPPLRQVIALLVLVGLMAAWLCFNRLGEPGAPV